MCIGMSIYSMSAVGDTRDKGVSMGNLKHYYEAIKNGDVFFDEYRKSSLILNAVTALHVGFLVFFWITDVVPMVIYNGGAVFAYQGILLLIKRQKTYLAYILTCIEVVLHAVLATIFAGFGSGFQVYCVAMIAVSCYITFTWECFKKGQERLYVSPCLACWGILHVILLRSIRNPGLKWESWQRRLCTL